MTFEKVSEIRPKPTMILMSISKNTFAFGLTVNVHVHLKKSANDVLAGAWIHQSKFWNLGLGNRTFVRQNRKLLYQKLMLSKNARAD